jgi:hypothetical protein
MSSKRSVLSTRIRIHIFKIVINILGRKFFQKTKAFEVLEPEDLKATLFENRNQFFPFKINKESW